MWLHYYTLLIIVSLPVRTCHWGTKIDFDSFRWFFFLFASFLGMVYESYMEKKFSWITKTIDKSLSDDVLVRLLAMSLCFLYTHISIRINFIYTAESFGQSIYTIHSSIKHLSWIFHHDNFVVVFVSYS